MKETAHAEAARAVNAEFVVPAEESRRDVVLREAARLFAEQGYDNTTIRNIATAVGIQSGSLFYHFPTKEHILAAIIGDSVTWGLSVARSFVAQGGTPPERFEALIRGHLSALLNERSRNAQRVSIREWRRLPVELRQPIEQLNDQYRAMWWQVMAELEASGLLRISKEVFYHFCVGGLNWTASWYDEAAGIPIDDLARDYIALLRSGMRGE